MSTEERFRPSRDEMATAMRVLEWAEASAKKPTAALAVWSRSVLEWIADQYDHPDAGDTAPHPMPTDGRLREKAAK